MKKMKKLFWIDQLAPAWVWLMQGLFVLRQLAFGAIVVGVVCLGIVAGFIGYARFLNVERANPAKVFSYGYAGNCQQAEKCFLVARVKVWEKELSDSLYLGRSEWEDGEISWDLVIVVADYNDTDPRDGFLDGGYGLHVKYWWGRLFLEVGWMDLVMQG